MRHGKYKDDYAKGSCAWGQPGKEEDLEVSMMWCDAKSITRHMCK